jgi:CubicO group peptidase (beta-lactamase class C family)
MRILYLVLSVLLLPAGSSAAQMPGVSAQAASPAESSLAGLWKAKRWFGPDERGTLILERTSNGWTADFLGRSIKAESQGDVLTFALPGGRGSFRARLNRNGSLSAGQWFQPGSQVAPPFGSNIVFLGDGPGRWRGEVRPWDHEFTLYLMVQQRPDGTFDAFIRNPERNIGYNLGVKRLERDGDAVRLVGTRLGRASEETVMSGTYDDERDVIRLVLPERGGSFDFRREGDDSDFWPRGRNPGRYVYLPPLGRGDGWPVSTLDKENIDRRGIEAFVQWILETPMDSVAAHEVHGILIARNGKLVLEEYFHGFDRDRPHDTRSAAKSLTATLIGAAIQAGLPVRLTDPVYRTMNGGTFPPNLEARKRSMQLQHLLTMTSGIHCDDSDPNAPGNENTMTDQADEPDYWRFYMVAPMDRTPGERAIYCSGDPNLAIGVLSRATGEHAMDLFDRLIAGPLRMQRHIWFLSPSLQPYGGGSLELLPRDFLKVGQLMANGGTWKGRRILSREFVNRASSNLCPLNRIGYGYLWWTLDYPYKDRTVRAYFAGGNGGQGIFVVSSLDLVIGTFGGSFTSRVGLEIQQGYIPRHILPAVREEGDRTDTPVSPRAYEVAYRLQRPAPPCPQSSFLHG